MHSLLTSVEVERRATCLLAAKFDKYSQRPCGIDSELISVSSSEVSVMSCYLLVHRFRSEVRGDRRNQLLRDSSNDRRSA